MVRGRGGIALALVVSLGAGVPQRAEAAPDRDVATPSDEASPPPSEDETSGGEASTSAPASTEPRDPETIRAEKRIEEAERHFIEGRTLYNQGRYLEAAAEFERSFAAIERAETLYNIVLSHELAGQPIAALRAAKRYNALPDCVGEDGGMCAKHREKVRGVERRLRPQVGELSLDLQRGAKLREIRVDGRLVPQVEFPLLLMPGPYDLELVGTREGQRRTFVVDVKAGQVRVVDVAPFVDERGDPLVGAQPPNGPDPLDLEEQRRREERRRKALRGAFYGGLGLTVTAGAATATFGALTLRAKRLHTEQACPTPCTEPQDGVPPHIDRRAEYRRYVPVTNALIGVTAVLGVTTAIVGIFAFTGQGSRRGSQRYGLSPGGLVVRW
jgi:hypothetical protein